MYTLLRKIFFLFDAEEVHYFVMSVLRFICGIPLLGKWTAKAFTFRDPGLECSFAGLRFRNPVGLAAGFDKNAKYLRELEALGFGSVEIGTVTPLGQPGNDRPRMFRLPADRALINRMGFNNDGVKAVADRLKDWRERQLSKGRDKVGLPLIIGGNIGKNKVTPNEEAWKDYDTCFRVLFDVVDYFVVNVSSPNTPGLRELQEKDALGRILSHLQALNGSYPVRKPLLLKISPDLTAGQLDDIIDLALSTGLDGLVVANTTIGREGLSPASVEKAVAIGAGGLSGAPVKALSTAMIRHIHERSGGRIPVIGSGGIFTTQDALEKLEAGASIVQVWTGFIYEGPATASRICEGLARSRTF
jgi:dihydroorotate dehydrogenase